VEAHSAASVWEQPDEDVLTVMAKVCAPRFIYRHSQKLSSSQLYRLQDPTVSRELSLLVATEIPFA
jgi:hypothetical protein